MKIITVLGTRPEIIKLSPLLPLLDKEFKHVLIHSGQHYSYEMDGLFFDELKLRKPDYNLNVGSANPGEQIANIIKKLEAVMLKEKPDLVLTLGDTNTTLAASLTAAKLLIKSIHIEAGCRSFNKKMPEEINRIIADHCVDYLFAPDDKSMKNLLCEGIAKNKIYLTGSLVIDACLRNKKFTDNSNIKEKLKLKDEPYLLATIHRAENTDDITVLTGIISAFNELSKKIKIIFSVHPRTKKIIEENHIQIERNILLSEPLSYINLLKLMQEARFIISDSGGIQEEASVVNVPCVIARNETEWTRLTEVGKNFLAGNQKESLLKTCNKLLDNAFLGEIKKIKIDLVNGVDQKIISLLKNIESGN